MPGINPITHRAGLIADRIDERIRAEDRRHNMVGMPTAGWAMRFKGHMASLEPGDANYDPTVNERCLREKLAAKRRCERILAARREELGCGGDERC